MAKKKFYAVRQGRKIGMFLTWDECKKQVMGYPGAIYKSFGTEEEAKEYLGKICSSGNLLMTIINQILEIARIESGTIALQLKAEDINAVFHTVNTVFEEDVRKKNLQYSVDLDVYHTFIFCDRVKLQEIMLNIISNAIKYTSDGHAVHVKIYEKDSENPRKARFIFTCEDTGIGMSEEYLPHIFEEFSREHTTTENKVAGTGLGLPIVKSMIELMGGSIQVESTQGVGTKFTVDISFDTASEADVYRNQISEQPDILEKLEGKRILLAEDNELNAEIAIELLAEQKIITDRAEDGAECLDKLEKAASGYSSISPSMVALNPRTVSFSGTYFPGTPVNVSATENGCDRNFWIFLARATVILSSSDNSSIPRIAMMSCNSLYFCRISCTLRATW